MLCNKCIFNGLSVCGKCKDIINYDSKYTIITDNNKSRLICLSCFKAKEYIKDWLFMINYKCSSCNGWNFRYRNVTDDYKKQCTKCFFKSKQFN